MWRIYNKLFGWHYVTLRSASLGYRYIRRLRKTSSEEMYVDFCGGVWFLLDDYQVDNGYTWKPLTW